MTDLIPSRPSPVRLAIRLAIYFFLLITSIIVALQLVPEIFKYLPFGGRHALEGTPTGTSAADLLRSVTGSTPNVAEANDLDSVEAVILFVVGHLTGTLILMLPITWTYSAIHWDVGFRRGFVRALMVLPLCATTVVLLIQDSLALAFGLAALVAAVRFRVALDEAMDGIFIFAAICVGLAAGIGYLGVATVMSLFFCFTNLAMWALEYGRNPSDEARIARKKAKLGQSAAEVTKTMDL
jgi:hypothetical protein